MTLAPRRRDDVDQRQLKDADGKYRERCCVETRGDDVLMEVRLNDLDANRQRERERIGQLATPQSRAVVGSRSRRPVRSPQSIAPSRASANATAPHITAAMVPITSAGATMQTTRTRSEAAYVSAAPL